MKKINTELLDTFKDFMYKFVGFDKTATYQEYEKLRNDLLTYYCDKGILCDWIIQHKYGSHLVSFFKDNNMTSNDKRKLITDSYTAMILKCSINNTMCNI